MDEVEFNELLSILSKIDFSPEQIVKIATDGLGLDIQANSDNVVFSSEILKTQIKYPDGSFKIEYIVNSPNSSSSVFFLEEE